MMQFISDYYFAIAGWFFICLAIGYWLKKHSNTSIGNDDLMLN